MSGKALEQADALFLNLRADHHGTDELVRRIRFKYAEFAHDLAEMIPEGANCQIALTRLLDSRNWAEMGVLIHGNARAERNERRNHKKIGR